MSETKVRLSVAVATVLMLNGSFNMNVAAAEQCARSREQTAVYTAVLRTQLMVAALSCGNQGRYNAFVTRFQLELSAQGRTLRGWFRRQHGTADDRYLNKFVTRLANEQAQRSAAARAPFCAQASALFHQLLDEPRLSLAGVLGDPALVISGVTCADSSLAKNLGAAREAKAHPLSKPLPIAK